MRKKTWVVVLLCLLCASILALPAFAADAPKTGSLKVSILETGTGSGIANAQVDIYLVASDDGIEALLTPGFAGSGFDLDTLENMTGADNKAKASELAAYALAQKVPVTATKTTDANGAVKFDNIEQGLYLVRESASPAGHAPINAFLITIPQYLNGEAVYEVDAAPKTGTSDVQPTPSPTPTSGPTPTPEPRLPQTGQLWWPVYVLVGAGLVFCLLGVTVLRKKGHE